MANYILDFSDPAKGQITLIPKQIDTASTSLTLTGKGSSNYGESQQENFLKILESFASASAPVNPTIGQLWWKTLDPAKPALMVLKSKSPDVWVPVGDPLVRIAYNYEYNRLAELYRQIVGTTVIGTNCSDSYGWGDSAAAALLPNRYLQAEPALNPNWVFLLGKWKTIASLVGVSPIRFESDGFIIDDQFHIEEGAPGSPAGEAKGIATIMDEYESTKNAAQEVWANRFNIAPSNLQLQAYAPINRASYWLSETTLTLDFTWANQADLQTYFITGGYLKLIPSLENAIGTDPVTNMWIRLINGLGGGILIKGCATIDQTNNPNFSTHTSIFELDNTFKMLYKANEREVFSGIGAYDSATPAAASPAYDQSGIAYDEPGYVYNQAAIPGVSTNLFGNDADLGWGDITIEGKLLTPSSLSILMTFDNERLTEVNGLLRVISESRKANFTGTGLTIVTAHPTLAPAAFT
jgi:hypothetical protein